MCGEIISRCRIRWTEHWTWLNWTDLNWMEWASVCWFDSLFVYVSLIHCWRYIPFVSSCSVVCTFTYGRKRRTQMPVCVSSCFPYKHNGPNTIRTAQRSYTHILKKFNSISLVLVTFVRSVAVLLFVFLICLWISLFVLLLAVAVVFCSFVRSYLRFILRVRGCEWCTV